MSNFDKYIRAFDEGLLADGLTTDQNPHADNPYMQLGWWHGKVLAVTFEADFTSAWMHDVVSTSPWYWKAHAQGMASHRFNIYLMRNPYSPKTWDSLQCPEKGDRVSWNGWAAGWRLAALLNNFQPGDKV